MSISYKDAGVDVSLGASLVSEIKAEVSHTHNEHVLNTIGSFAALYNLQGYKNPVLVSGTDGVGTKMMLAIAHKKYEHIGQDCVAMCVNDILCHGATPLFFLDYLACGSLSLADSSNIVKSVARACKSCDCALVGGETAEMPGMYKPGDYDIAGFVLGVVEKDRIIDGSNTNNRSHTVSHATSSAGARTTISSGDALIACASSGLHSNGFSLVRKLFPNTNIMFEGRPLFETLLEPTKIYTKAILAAIAAHNTNNDNAIAGIAHITGGGLVENVPRMIPEGLWACIDSNAIPRLPIYELIKNHEQIDALDLWHTFNMGVGMVLAVKNEHTSALINTLASHGEQGFIIGQVKDSPAENYIIKEHKVCLI